MDATFDTRYVRPDDAVNGFAVDVYRYVPPTDRRKSGYGKDAYVQIAVYGNGDVVYIRLTEAQFAELQQHVAGPLETERY